MIELGTSHNNLQTLSFSEPIELSENIQAAKKPHQVIYSIYNTVMLVVNL